MIWVHWLKAFRWISELLWYNKTNVKIYVFYSSRMHPAFEEFLIHWVFHEWNHVGFDFVNFIQIFSSTVSAEVESDHFSVSLFHFSPQFLVISNKTVNYLFCHYLSQSEDGKNFIYNFNCWNCISSTCFSIHFYPLESHPYQLIYSMIVDACW